MKKADVNVFDQEKCQSWYTSQGKKTKIQDSQMCAGHEKGGIDACWVSIPNFSTLIFKDKIHNN